MSIKFNCKRCINWKCTDITCDNYIIESNKNCSKECKQYSKALYCQNSILEAIAEENSIDNYCINYKEKEKKNNKEKNDPP